MFFGRVEMNSQMDEQQSQTSGNQETQSQQEPNTQQEARREADGKELIDELTRLGQKFVEVVEVAWNSEQRRKIEEDLRTGVVSVASSLEEGVKRVGSSKEAQEAVRSAEGVAEKLRTSKIASELSDALADGLRSLSDRLDQLSEEMKQKSATSQSTAQSSAQSTGTTAQGTESQDIPIAREDQE